MNKTFAIVEIVYAVRLIALETGKTKRMATSRKDHRIAHWVFKADAALCVLCRYHGFLVILPFLNRFFGHSIRQSNALFFVLRRRMIALTLDGAIRRRQAPAASFRWIGLSARITLNRHAQVEIDWIPMIFYGLGCSDPQNQPRAMYKIQDAYRFRWWRSCSIDDQQECKRMCKRRKEYTFCAWNAANSKHTSYVAWCSGVGVEWDGKSRLLLDQECAPHCENNGGKPCGYRVLVSSPPSPCGCVQTSILSLQFFI